MKRLTKKEIIGDMTIYSYGDINLDGLNVWGIPTHKLGQLEDIEEELGIDLITYFKLKRGAKICVPSLGDNYEIESVVNGMYHICQIGTRSGFYVTTNEYGKTWALTKEELENGKK